MKMELGFFVPHLPREGFVNLAMKAESIGFDFICCDDHLMSPFEPGDTGFGCYEAWTAMAYLAGKTEKIRLSHMVLVPGFRGPALLANMGATLDVLSGGRLILTVGAGWFEREYEAYHLPWEGHDARIKREREAVKIIQALWTENHVSFEGQFYKVKDATLSPKPLQKPTPPIWISGDSKPSMELAAELGDGWQLHGHSPEEVSRMISRIRPLLGKGKEDFGVGSAHVVILDKDKEEAYAKLKRMIPPETWDRFMTADIRLEIKHRISGSPKECIERIKEYRETGLNRLIFIFFDPNDIDLFAREVLPEIRD